MKEIFTIKEVAGITGKSEVTIRRLITQKLKDDHAEGNQLIRREKTPSGFFYTIDKAFLEQENLLPTQEGDQEGSQDKQVHSQKEKVDYADDKAEEGKDEKSEHKQGDQDEKATTQPDDQEGSQPLFDSLAGTIEVLKGQLDAKDEQISKLMQSRENADLLIANLSQQLQLKAGDQSVEGEITEVEEQEDSGPTTTQEQEESGNEAEQGSEEQEKGFFGRMFSKN